MFPTAPHWQTQLAVAGMGDWHGRRSVQFTDAVYRQQPPGARSRVGKGGEWVWRDKQEARDPSPPRTHTQRRPSSKVPTQGRTSPAEVWGEMPQARNSKWKDPEEGSAWSHPRKRKVTAEGARDKDYRIIPGVQITQDFTAHCPRPWRRQRAAHHRRWAHPQESLIRLTCDRPDTVHF